MPEYLSRLLPGHIFVTVGLPQRMRPGGPAEHSIDFRPTPHLPLPQTHQQDLRRPAKLFLLALELVSRAVRRHCRSFPLSCQLVWLLSLGSVCVLSSAQYIGVATTT